MKAISKRESLTKIQFDLSAPINPLVGLGGVSFTNTIKDFQEMLTSKSFINDNADNLEFSIDSKYFYLTITTLNKELGIEINLFNGRINSMTCRKGYLGRLDEDFGIGTSIKEALEKDKTLGFNLDQDWFDRIPFDGLIIYPPSNLIDKCIDAAVSGTDFPNFNIETIELIELSFAKEHFPDGQLTFE